MQLEPFAEALRRDLAASAQAGGTEVREAAERLAVALDPALRLTLMDALAQAAEEISAELDGASVEVRLKGREPVFVVDAASTPAFAEPVPTAGEEDGEPDDSGVVRITLRIPVGVKTRAEELAARQGQSLNTWLVHAARLAATTAETGSWTPGVPPGFTPRARKSGKRIQGWVR
jgi:hypothetical protein